MRWLTLSLSIGVFAGACGPQDDEGTEADELGVGASCASNDDCELEEQTCLTQFKGGYCGLEGCEIDDDCPQGSGCVAHTDGQNYCFRLCVNKSECNLNRGPDEESNCVASVSFTDGGGGKACVPPSG